MRHLDDLIPVLRNGWSRCFIFWAYAPDKAVPRQVGKCESVLLPLPAYGAEEVSPQKNLSPPKRSPRHDFGENTRFSEIFPPTAT